MLVGDGLEKDTYHFLLSLGSPGSRPRLWIARSSLGFESRILLLLAVYQVQLQEVQGVVVEEVVFCLLKRQRRYVNGLRRH